MTEAGLDESQVVGVKPWLDRGEVFELAMDLRNSYQTSPTLGVEDE
jgi:hypothetical protein